MVKQPQLNKTDKTKAIPLYLKNRYRLTRWLAESEMGAIYCAKDELLNRDIAIKFLTLTQFNTQQAKDDFIKEAYAVTRLTQPNITTLHDVGEEDDWIYLILEYTATNNIHHRSTELEDSFASPSTSKPTSKPTSNKTQNFIASTDTFSTIEMEYHHLARLLQRNILEPLNLLLTQTTSYQQSMGNHPASYTAFSVLGSLIRQIMQQTRDLEANLHPVILQTIGLQAALEALNNQMERNYGLSITLNLARLQTQLAPDLALNLFRIIQNGLEWLGEYGRATQVTISLQQIEKKIFLQLSDNGLTAVIEKETLAYIKQRVNQLNGDFNVKRNQQGGGVLSISFSVLAATQLTPREMEVIGLLVEGLSNKEMARQLSVSPRTVNFHLDNIYSKLGVNSRTEAAIYALQQGWASN